MRKRKQRGKFNFVLLLAFSFCFVFMATAYSILIEKIVVTGNARITPTVSGEAAEYIESVVGNEPFYSKNNGVVNFKGDDDTSVYNYIEFPENGFLWRILSIDASGNIKIILEKNEGLYSPFMTNGVTWDWATSIVLQNLKIWYQDNLSNYSDDIVQNPEWLITEASKNRPTSVTVIGSFTDSPIGLIRNDEVLNSSGSGPSSNGKEVPSWISGDYQWTMTAVDRNIQAWKMNNSKFMNSSAYDSTQFRPVIYLKSNVSISSGNGTFDYPFVVS